jgi:hypothetical protein
MGVKPIAGGMVVGGAEIFFLAGGVGHVFHKNAAVAGAAAPFVRQRVASSQGRGQFIAGKKHQSVAEAVQALKTQPDGERGVAGGRGFLFQLRLVRCLSVSAPFFAAQKALDGAVVTARMTGLVAGSEGFVNIALSRKVS